MMDPRNILLESRLNAIHGSLDELGSITESNLNVLLDRLATGQIRDLVPMNVAAKIANDHCKHLLALHTLHARELRFTMAAVRIVQDYEHIGVMLNSFHRRIDRYASSEIAPLFMNFKTSLNAIIDLQNAVQATLQLPQDFDRLHLCVQALSAVAEAGLSAIELAMMDIIMKDSSKSDDLFELLLACRNLSQLTTLLEAIPGELRAFAAVPTAAQAA